MAEASTNSIVNLGDLTKPADTLIKKISNAVGGFFEPYQIKRIAKAEAEAALIKAQSEIEITELQRRAMHRFIDEESRHQLNMENITSQTIPLLTAEAKPEEINNDWLTNFFDKSRIVSDSEMQKLWASILAGEANAPGTFSKRTVNFVGELDKSDAEMFTKICSFCINIQDLIPVVFNYEDDIYVNNNLHFSMLTHLDSIGLIKFEPLKGFANYRLPKLQNIRYFNKVMQIEFQGEGDEYSLEIGTVLFTKIGLELAPICNSSPIPGFYEYLITRWKEHKPKEIHS